MVIKTPKALLPALHGRLVVDTINGKVRVRKWPEKRGPNVPPQVRIQNERFAEAQRMSKEAKGIVMNRFHDATKNTGLYPRDLFTKLVLAPPIAVTLEDGRVITFRRPTLETEVFQGVILRRAANYGYAATTLVNVPWDDIILNPQAMWDAAEPDRITIPAGVAVVNLFGGFRRNALVGNFLTCQIAASSQAEPPLCELAQSAGGGGSICTGPLVVSEGDQFSFMLYGNSAGTALAQRTFFGCQILAAEV